MGFRLGRNLFVAGALLAGGPMAAMEAYGATKKRLEKLEALFKPKAVIKFVMTEEDITAEEGVIWVIFKL